MVLVEHDAVVVLATGVTASSGVLPVLPDTAMAGTHVPALMPVTLQTCPSGRGGGEEGGRRRRFEKETEKAKAKPAPSRGRRQWLSVITLGYALGTR